MIDIFENLNEEQIEAVTTTEGFIRVIAGAGSGKTRALTHRFAYLVNEMDILPGNILCVTFTNKAAAEMRQRIHRLTGDNDTGYINTFHGFCVSVLDEESYAVQYPRSFIVLDNSDIDSMLKIIYEERGLTLRDMSFKDARDMIEIKKLYEIPDYYLDMINMSLERLYNKYINAVNIKDIIFYGYLYQEKKLFALDYNDLLKFTLFIFKEHEDIRLKWQQKLQYIMIDEFQDIDFIQYELMEVLCAYHKNLFVVGDPDQTIYTWRGANIKYLLTFEDRFPGAKTIMMNKNYRSTPEILACANSLVEKNKSRIRKDLVAQQSSGARVICHHGRNIEDEAGWICAKVNELHEAGMKYADISVLYRAHYITRSIEEAMLKEKIPYHIYSGVQFFERMEIKDALSYLRMIAYKDDLSFMRVINTPKRNMGNRRMAFLQEYAQANNTSLYDALLKNLDDEIFKGTKAAAFVKLMDEFSLVYRGMSVSKLLAEVLDKSGYELMLRTEGSQERLDNLAELKQSIYDYETSCGEEVDLVHYLERVALFTNADAELMSDKVKLMTVHAAKGLEFPVVFLCSMNEDIFPSKKISTIDAMEEERRLAFVALTRAEKMLFISEAEGRTLDGAPRYPSRFILDIDESLFDYDVPPNDDLLRLARNYIQSRENSLPENIRRNIIASGTRIRHKIFGDGVIISADVQKSVYVIKFDNLETDRILNIKAKLEPI